MNFSFFKGKSRRSLIFTVITLFSIVFLLAGNFVLSYFSPVESIYFDITKEGLYTLTDAMKKECSFVEKLEDGKKIKIIFCDDRDRLINNTATRATYFMALQLQDMYSEIEVETVNATLNPTALAPYKATSLTTIAPTDIIITYGERYRLTNADRFWTFSSDEYWSYNGEYRMASLLKSVTAIEQPKAYFVTDHNETYYDPNNPESEGSRELSSFAALLRERGLQIATIRISEVDKIPDDCSLLIINNPTLDFATDPSQYGSLNYVSDTEKIDRYLVKNQGAIMVVKDYRTKLPVLETFLYDWGIEFGNTLLKDEISSLQDEGNTNTALITEYNTDTNSYGYAIYSDFASVSSSPRVVFTDAGYVKCSMKESTSKAENGSSGTSRKYASFLSTSKNAKSYAKNSLTGEYQDLAGYASVYDVAAIAAREHVDTKKNESFFSYVFCANSKDFLSNSLLGNASYANYDVVSSLTENISRLDEYASMELGGLSLNSSSYGGKQLQYATLSEEDVAIYSGDGKEILEQNYAVTNGFIIAFSIVVFLFPIGLIAFGIVVCAKRRFL